MAERGRPSSLNQEIANKLCTEIASTSRSLRTICKDEGMPSISSVFRWLSDENNKDFREQYARAKECQADIFVEEIIDIADDKTTDTLAGENGESGNSVSVQRARLQIDSRKWVAGKQKPKKYGEKLDLTSDGKEIHSLVPVINVYNSAPPMASSEDEIE